MCFDRAGPYRKLVPVLGFMTNLWWKQEPEAVTTKFTETGWSSGLELIATPAKMFDILDCHSPEVMRKLR